ncbi:MAG: class II aldolase/adducin family protein [Gaiellales bacterium]
MSAVAVDPEMLRAARENLAALLRISAVHGYNEGIDNHYSLAVDGHDDLFLLNRYGPHWSEMVPGDILLVDLDGNVVDGAGDGQITALQIHRQIHRARPDARCVMHTHMPYASAIASTTTGFITRLTQNSMSFHGSVATLDYGGQVQGDGEGERLARAVAEGANAIFLQNHGVIIVGATPAEAWLRTYFLERACEVQVLAQSTGSELVLAPESVAEHTARQWADACPEEGPLLFDAMKRLLDRDQPGWRG